MVAAGDATLETKLNLSVEANGNPRLTAELGHVHADEVFRDALSDGNLAPRMLGGIRDAVFSAIEKGTDLKIIMPPAGRAAATISKAQFEEFGAGQLRLILDGKLQFSDEQTKEFAAELKQQLSTRTVSSN